ncbi:carboxypeptidase-like regulatory domain-containing protein [Winogradskyella echinorum]|uniref:Carboxypeptidase-like regulatory domain-containing protein n=1 Tax=Winogradskyella echinorum TaxID=538189 RepID=A0ABR6Y0C1_9FLAO|nr:DUF5686 family protein [Winogradskyella echinorum]MBC3846124.1 carboxypeptidase-like regulatory domain-containing protein [Winogradskyella echinorum]MBC5750472.1 carboxypeptidase-like regulatory domain-containing protein [Winogradskyella echinorum]
MKYFFLFPLLLLSLNIHGQSHKKFTLIDDTTENVIPFANVLFSEVDYKGTSTDIDGVFYIPRDIEIITISYVGYETKTLRLNKITSQFIRLKSKVSELDEVVIDGENPAHRIIRLAVASKDLNNPENLNSYTYKSYDKIIITTGNQKKERDTIREKLDSIMKGSYFFITETIAKHKYLKPRFSEDSVIATRSSGFKNPQFAMLANAFQPFSFYEEHISLFETNYLNPISKGSTRKYKFRLKEEYIKGNDTVFVISFEPKSNRNFEGLKGFLQINSNKYAVQSVDATTFNSGKINVTIQQKYNYIENSYWFPEQLNFEINVGEGFGSAKYVGKSYLSEIKPNASLSKKDFPFFSVTLPKGASSKGDDFWSLNRRDTLDFREKRTYAFIDSLGEKIKIDKIFNLLPSLLKGRIPFKYVDVDINQLLRYNKYEGNRIGLGLYTNDDIFKDVSIGGYAAYGFKDKAWKYGGDLLIEVPGKKDISIQLKYVNDLRETGKFSGNSVENPFVQRNWIASQMDGIEAYSINTNMKLYRNINWSLGFNTAKVTPLYDYQFVYNGSSITNYTNSEINLGIGYHVKEKLVNNFGITTRMPNDAPVFNLIYSKGLNGTFDSDFRYNKLRFTLDHSFNTKGLGKTTYRLDLGYIDSTLPYGLLFTGEGTYDKDIPFVVRNYFQTAVPYEFLSDKYAHLFTTHNFGRLFNNKGYLQPDVLLHNNFGVGRLDNASSHQSIAFKTKENIFLETGLELQNLIKIPLMELGYFGIGVGAFYRYGYHHLEKSSDNFAFKYSMGFSFK